MINIAVAAITKKPIINYVHLNQHFMRLFLLVTIVFFGIVTSVAQTRVYTSKKISNTPPQIDGIIDEDAWMLVDWQGDFTQREPNEGAAPSQKTQFKIIYDDNNLYVAIRAFDTEPDKIVRRMSRRDGFDGDFVEINLDSHNDKITAYSFTASVSGVKGDEFISNDGQNWDATWDPVWYLKTSIDTLGWIAEIKIPFNQLRFEKKEEYVWGLQINRRFYRNDERMQWQLIPRESKGFVSRFGKLEGIKSIHPRRLFELTPYIVGGVESYKKEESNPFSKGVEGISKIGIDGKFGLTNNLTVDFTINPDFGQVEADPSEVNLTAFETYFSEKRPYFIEGRSILNYQVSMGGNSFAKDNLFYSRRIGRNPHYYPKLGDGEYADVPQNSTILGAVKLTGKTNKGWSIGVMESVTAKEIAEVDRNGNRSEEIVEPLTNYFLGRAQKDFNKGNTRVGAMLTSTYRFFEDGDVNVNNLNKSAFTGGFDLNHEWKDKQYYTYVKLVYSQVNGTSSAINSTQTASQRYFNRPGADYLNYDPSATELDGNGGTFQIGKQGGGNWRGLFWLTWRSPGLELNDVGYLRQADQVFQVNWVQYQIRDSFSIFRNMYFNFNQWSGFNFNREMIFKGINLSMNTQFKNFLRFSAGVGFEGDNLQMDALRGGPMLRRPGSINYWSSLSSDFRKKIMFGINYNGGTGNEATSQNNNFGGSITFRPIDALNISFEPSVGLNYNSLQYVSTLKESIGNKYIMSSMDQITYDFPIRVSYNLTPDFSIQYYAAPFLSAGEYYNFKEIISPMDKILKNRYVDIDDSKISYNADNKSYKIDGYEKSFGQKSYNSLQFRSNVVARWEYMPGSVFYFVWTQNRSENGKAGKLDFKNDLKTLFAETPTDVFMLKFSYCFKN